jgi:hypothetical protein
MRRAAGAAVVGAALLGGAGTSAAGSTAQQTMTIYANATQAQFMDFSDDRERGIGKNPFKADVDALLPQSKAKQAGGCPCPGDKAMYSFNLYRDAVLKNKIGSAVYVCSFSFKKRAFCSADYQLRDGKMFAAGLADFAQRRFTLAVTGGTSKYLGATGQVSAAPAKKDAHRLSFLLLG